MALFLDKGWSKENDPFPSEWSGLIKLYEDNGDVRKKDGEW